MGQLCGRAVRGDVEVRIVEVDVLMIEVIRCKPVLPGREAWSIAWMNVVVVNWLSVDERSLRWARDEICAMSNLFGGRCCRDSEVCPNRALCAQRLQMWSDSACSGCSFEVSNGTWPSERSVGICERMRKRIGSRIKVWISWTQS